MKKLLIAVIICLLLVFSACGDNGNTGDDGSQSSTLESGDINTDDLQTNSSDDSEEVTSSEKWTNNY